MTNHEYALKLLEEAATLITDDDAYARLVDDVIPSLRISITEHANSSRENYRDYWKEEVATTDRGVA